MGTFARTIIAGSCFPRPSRCPPRSSCSRAACISCFAGYRVFRIVLGIYGFILGALFASSAMGTEHTLWMMVAALRRRRCRRADPDCRVLRRRRAARRGRRRARGQPDLGCARPRAARTRGDPVRDRRRARRARAAALRHHRRHRVRRRMDRDRRRRSRSLGDRVAATAPRATTSGWRIRCIRRRASNGCCSPGSAWDSLGAIVQLGVTAKGK